MYIYHRIPDYATYCIAILTLIHYIVVTFLSRSKTVVGFFPIAAICRVLPNKSQPEHVFHLLPWHTKSIFIINNILMYPASQKVLFFNRLLRQLLHTASFCLLQV